jgi:hypothetical protein
MGCTSSAERNRSVRIRNPNVDFRQIDAPGRRSGYVDSGLLVRAPPAVENISYRLGGSRTPFPATHH